MFGIRSMEDARLYYMIMNGEIPVPKSAVYDWEHWADRPSDAASFTRGMFNLKKWYQPANRSLRYNQRTDPFGGFDGAPGASGLGRYGTNYGEGKFGQGTAARDAIAATNFRAL